jgi:hypothetical protein
MTRIASVVTSLLLALGLAALLAPAAHAQQETGSRGTITAQALMQDLANYGVWMSHPKLGWVWQPHDVQPWWQPFIEGEWIVTQDGSPYWRSAYPFGWATEHYGSWTYDDRKGWLWVPSNEWSPAPVSWRAVDGIVGWAPQLASAAETQSVECPQPTFAWIFIRSERLLTTSSFEVAEKELMSDEAHGTWGAWAHNPTGVNRERIPSPRNVNMLEVTKCLPAAEAKAMFGAAVRARGGTTQGPAINFVSRRSEMGSGRARAGYLPVYAPVITGNPPPANGPYVLNAPVQPVQPVQPATMVTRVPAVIPPTPPAGAQPLQPVAPIRPVLPPPAVAPIQPVAPVNAFSYQQTLLTQYHGQMADSVRNMHESDATSPPYPGVDPAKLPDWKKRELAETAREVERQRKLLEARQQEHGQAQPSSDSTTKP